jgi:outer membrane lipoprotein-sorting protein
MIATVQETASLGLPDLPGSSDPLSGLSMLSGSHTFKIWYAGPARVRVAIPVSLGETDLRRDGRNVWLWDSQTNKATHYILPAGAADAAPSAPAQSVPTPQQLAKQILAAVGSTTNVGLQQNVTVAGQPAYQLSLAPKDSRSLIGQVRIAIDARNSLPLQVQVFARGASSPAFSVGYTSLSFAKPAASNFAFSPPPGAKVKTVTVPAGLPAGPVGIGGVLPNVPAGTPSSGAYSSSLRVSVPTGAVALRMNASTGKVVFVKGGKHLPASVRKQIAAAIANAEATSSKSNGGGWVNYSSQTGAVSSGVITASSPAGPTVLGKGWLSVAMLPSSAPASGGANAENVLGALVAASTPVHGSWGSGRLLRTSLFSVLMLSDGRVLVGAVVPSVLYADAAHLR